VPIAGRYPCLQIRWSPHLQVPVAVAPAALADALQDRYTLERELGRGGMATVYLAQDIRYRRPVAIKVLHAELAHALGPGRFLREIEIAAQLQHPHILPLLDSGEAAGLLYYVMPYVSGQSLRSRLNRERQLPWDDVLQITEQIASALAYAHEQGVVHRDIKPENILLEGDQAVLADFGIARAVSAAGGERLTETGLALGTSAYMSPEQAAGDRHLDSRSDIYSLGCVVYEMLAGEPPFTGPSVQAVMARHSLDPVPHLRTVRSTVPEAVEQVVFRALAKVPADRFATARQLADALAVAARAQGVPPMPRRRPRRSVVLLSVGAAVFVATAAWWTSHRISASRDRPDALAPASPVPNRLAVLSFANLSPDTTDAYLAQGMSEEIASRLGDFSQISVAGRSAVARLERVDRADLSDHARALGLRYLVEGSVRRAGARVRISVRLVNASDGFRTWSQSYDRAAADLLNLQDEIGVDVARAVVGRLIPAESTATKARATRDPAAYDRLLRGNYYLAQRNPRGLARAIEAYSEAARLDPTFVLAHARLAYAHGLLLDLGWSYEGLPPESTLARGWDAIERAIQLDTTNAEVWQARGLLLRLRNPRTFAGVREAEKRAVDLDPDNADAHHEYGMTLRLLGDDAAAAAQFRDALTIEPDRPMSLLHLAWIDMAGRRFEEARRWLDSSTVVYPGFYQGYAERAELRLLTGDTAGARADAQTAVRLRPQVDVLTGESALLALDRRSGDTAGARARLIRLRRYAPRPDTLGVHQTAAWAAVLVAAGEDRQAIDFLEGVPVPTAHLRIHLEEVYFDAIRSNPRFERLLAGMRILELR
jgi:serine/threonine protein kinase/Tfp pilus assembly protein PilF